MRSSGADDVVIPEYEGGVVVGQFIQKAARRLHGKAGNRPFIPPCDSQDPIEPFGALYRRNLGSEML
jgi:hypothetical protein